MAGPERDDQALALAARGGDNGALDTLLRRHYDRLHALCRRLTGNDADAADACQEALVAVARGIAGFDGRASFGTWAYRVATNACLDEIRRRRRRPEPALPEERPPPSASDALEDLATRVDVDAALAELSPEFRTAVVLRDVADLSYSQIGEILGLPPGTVRSRIARGRAALATRLGAGEAAGERAGRNPDGPSRRQSSRG